MATLPNRGDSPWDTTLQTWLYVAHNTDGTLKSPSLGRIDPTFAHVGVLTVQAGAGRYPVTVAGTITAVRAAVGTAPTGAAILVDVNKNGTTVFTTQGNRPLIAAGTNSSGAAVPDVTSVIAGDLLSVDVDQIGSSVAGSDLVVVVLIQT